MEWDNRIGIGGDDIGTGRDELVMDLTHELRGFHQRQRRPFRLPERRADCPQLMPKTAIQNNHITLLLSSVMLGLDSQS